MKLTVLGSGSGGNCAFIETESTRILVDAGFSGRQISERLSQIQRSPNDLQAVLITHEHSDHIQGLPVLMNRFKVPAYSNARTRSAIGNLWIDSSPKNAQTTFPWKSFENGSPFVIGDLEIEPFSIPHDAADPVGFLIHHGNSTVCFLTDLGYTPQLVIEKARTANTLVMETNYDLKLLRADPRRPWAIKQRILSRHGHLGNETAARALEDILTDRLRHIYLAHLSADCNRPELAENAIKEKLEKLGSKQVALTRTCQERICRTEIVGTTQA